MGNNRFQSSTSTLALNTCRGRLCSGRFSLRNLRVKVVACYKSIFLAHFNFGLYPAGLTNSQLHISLFLIFPPSPMAAVIRLLRPSSSSFPLLSRSLSTAAVSQTVKSHAYLQKHLSPGEDPKSRNIQWVFLGCPGVGKGTYASRLSILLGVPHIATGDLVREELNSPTPLSKQVGLFY